MKKRLAIWIPGGIGTGHFSQGYPMLEKILIRLSEDFHIVVYSHAPPNVGYSSEHFLLRTTTTSSRPRWRWIMLLRHFFQDHQREPFDLLFACWGFPGGVLVTLLGKLLGLPSVIYILGGDAAGVSSIDYGIFHRPWKRRVALWAYKRTSVLITISRFQKDYLTQFGVDRIIDVIPWGADQSRFAFRKKSPEGVIHFLHAAHLAPVKDQVTLLRAFSLLSNQSAKLRIVGGDTMGGAIQKLCRELGLEDSVEFLDMVPYDEMPQHYSWAHILLHTSLSEGQCMSMTEAAATGVLIAGTRVGLLYDLGDQCGIAVQVGDFKALSERILEAVQNPQEWEAKVYKAQAWSQLHDFEWTITELKRILAMKTKK